LQLAINKTKSMPTVNRVLKIMSLEVIFLSKFGMMHNVNIVV